MTESYREILQKSGYTKEVLDELVKDEMPEMHEDIYRDEYTALQEAYEGEEE